MGPRVKSAHMEPCHSLIDIYGAKAQLVIKLQSTVLLHKHDTNLLSHVTSQLYCGTPFCCNRIFSKQLSLYNYQLSRKTLSYIVGKATFSLRSSIHPIVFSFSEVFFHYSPSQVLYWKQTAPLLTPPTIYKEELQTQSCCTK